MFCSVVDLVLKLLVCFSLCCCSVFFVFWCIVLVSVCLFLWCGICSMIFELCRLDSQLVSFLVLDGKQGISILWGIGLVDLLVVLFNVVWLLQNCVRNCLINWILEFFGFFGFLIIQLCWLWICLLCMWNICIVVLSLLLVNVIMLVLVLFLSIMVCFFMVCFSVDRLL